MKIDEVSVQPTDCNRNPIPFTKEARVLYKEVKLVNGRVFMDCQLPSARDAAVEGHARDSSCVIAPFTAAAWLT